MCVFLFLLLSPRPFILRTERKERGRFVRIKIAFRTVKRALISCRSEWKGCFGIFKLVDAYRRNVQLKRRCSGLESRERQLNRKITRPGENLSVYPPIKRMQIYRETCPVINVIIASRDRLSGREGAFYFFLFSLSYLPQRNFFFVSIKETERTRALRIPFLLPIIIATI